MSGTTDTRTWAQRFADHAGVKAPDGMTLGWRVVHADFRSRDGYRWPFPGGWATDTREGVDLRKKTAPNDPCPSDTLGGVCLAITTRGAASGSIPLRTVLVTAHHDKDVLGADADKLRVKRALVLEVVDAHAYLSGAYLYGANLSGANLYGANLCGANLYEANLSRADLSGAAADKWTRWPAGFDAARAGVMVR